MSNISLKVAGNRDNFGPALTRAFVERATRNVAESYRSLAMDTLSEAKAIASNCSHGMPVMLSGEGVPGIVESIEAFFPRRSYVAVDATLRSLIADMEAAGWRMGQLSLLDVGNGRSIWASIMEKSAA